MTLLAKRYAEALYAPAKGRGAIDAVGGELASLHQALQAPGARALLTSPDVTPAERSRLFGRLAQSSHPLVANLIGVLQHRRRIDALFDLHPAFRALAMADRGEVEGTAESAHPLDAAELQALGALAGRLSGKKVQLTTALRPELLGGVRLRIGNVLHDGSLLAALDQLERKLSQATI
jgi:F-type H+-transporting ATPase subunit delta